VEDGRLAPCGTHLRLIKQPGSALAVPSAQPASGDVSNAAMDAAFPLAVVSQHPSAEDLQYIVGSTGSTSSGERDGNSHSVLKCDDLMTSAHTVTPDESSPFQGRLLTEHAGLPNGYYAYHGATGVPPFKRKANEMDSAGESSGPGLLQVVHPPPSLSDPRLKRVYSLNSTHLSGSNGFASAPSRFVNSQLEDFPVRKSSIPGTSSSANGGPPAVSASGPPLTQKFVLSLPLGNTSPRELIHAVSAYTQLSCPQPVALAAHPNALYHAAGPVPPVFTDYECEPETDPRRNHLLMDSVGQHSVRDLHPPSGRRVSPSDTNPHAHSSLLNTGSQRAPPVSLIPPQAYAAPVSSETTSSSDASSTFTFRLGPRGSITKNA
jgi:hypothetical protein